MPNWPKVREATHNALSEAVAAEGVLLNKFVALAEVVGEDGSRSLWHMSSDSASTWDAIGMLVAGERLYTAEARDSFISEEDDDD